MIEYIPHRDDVERSPGQVRVLKRAADHILQAEVFAGVSDRGWRDFAAIRIPILVSRHCFQKEAESTPHVEQAPGPPRDKAFEKVAVHSGSGFAPIMVLAGRHFATPKSGVVRIGTKRRENVTAAPTPQYVDTEVRENDAMLFAATH
jgi:hypothetical protein